MKFFNPTSAFALLSGLLTVIGCERQEQIFEPHSYEDLRGHTISILEGSVQQDIANNELKDFDINAVYFNNVTDCMLAVRQGKAEMFFGCDIQAFNEAFKEQHLKVCHIIDDFKMPFAFGVKKGNTELLGKCNDFIDSLKRSGELDEIHDRWFKPTDNGYHECIKIEPAPTDPGTEENVLKIGISGVKDPAEVLIDNKWTGMEIELLQRFAALNGYALKIDTYDFSSLIPALQSDKVDIISATVLISDERKAKIDFASPNADLIGVFIVADQNVNETGLWARIKRSAYSSLIKENRWKLIMEGLWATILITILSLLGGSILGGFICAMRMSSIKWVRNFAKGYIYALRNIPILVFLMIMFYVVLAHSGLSAVTVAIIAFSISSAAFISEIYRTGIQSVDKGQTEAGRALGCSAFQTFLRIVAPQAIRISLPIFKNECITLLKSTSIVGFISIIDLTKASDLIRSASFEAFFPLITITIFYFIIASLLTGLLDLLLKRI